MPRDVRPATRNQRTLTHFPLGIRNVNTAAKLTDVFLSVRKAAKPQAQPLMETSG